MEQASFVGSFSLGGVTYSNGGTPGSIIEFDHPNPFVISLPVAHAVGGWTKTDFDTAAGTLTAGHGQTSGTYDIYWPGGKRVGVAGTIDGNGLALDGGTGDDFPASATAGVVAAKRTLINCTIQGDDVQVIGIFLRNVLDADAVGHVTFRNADSEGVADVGLQAGSFAQVYPVAKGSSNPFAGETTVVALASQSSTTGEATLYILSGEDSTP